MNADLVPLRESNPAANAVLIGYPSASKEVDFIVTLKGNAPLPEQLMALDSLLVGHPSRRRYLTHGEVASLTGSNADDAKSIESYFSEHGVRVKSINPLTRDVTLSGSIDAIEKSLNTEIGVFETVNRHAYLSNTRPRSLPGYLHGKIERLQPFSPPVKKEFRLPLKPLPDADTTGTFRSPVTNLTTPGAPAPEQGYSAIELAKAYRFPVGPTGKGQVIGIVELGGKLNPADFQQYFAQLHLKAPMMVEVGTPPVDSASTVLINNAEVTLDLEVVGALAPDAKLVVYYGNTLADALKEVISDKENNPSVLSISWAGSEFSYTSQETQELNLLIYQATLLGITIVAASADHGAYNGQSVPNVSLPSSHPMVMGCGGTIDTIADSQLVSQTVWNELSGQVASGGGYSVIYPQPAYQQAAVARYPFLRFNMRGVPDLAADASTVNGYQVVFNGKNTVIGGTSASTPFVAALVALMNEKLGYRLGFVNTLLYGFAGSDAFRQITSGNNLVYSAAPFWNPCTGLGSPVGDVLLGMLEQSEPQHDQAS